MAPNSRTTRSALTSSRHRRQTKRACIDCHARKVKCDVATLGIPCTNCKTSEVDCAIADRRKRKRQPQQSTPESEPGPEQETAAADAEHAAEDELAKEHLVQFFNQDLHDNPIRARSTYVGSELSNLNYLVRQQGANQHVHHYPCSNVYVPRIFRNSHPVTPNLIPRDAFVLPPKHISDALVAAYFDHVHPGLPIVDKAKFLASYDDDPTSAAPSPLLLQAICLVGCHVSDSHFPNHYEMKVAFFRRAKALLDGRYEEDRMHVVQAALLLTWFSDGGDDICANAWWWIGIAARTATGLGMHREVGASKMPDDDKVLWRRIWWCVVQFDCLVTLVYGRPQQVDPDECDVAPLTAQDFDQWATPTDVSFVIHHARLCSIISSMARSHFSLKAGVDKGAALDAFDEALVNWLVSLPPELREYETGAPWAALLHLTYNTALLQFHRANTRPGDVDICADAAASIIHIFSMLSSESLQLCWFWAPSALFAAILQVDRQVKCGNPVRAVHARAKYDTSMAILRKLSRHWLFATSVYRLFQSNSIGRADETSPVASLQSAADQMPVPEMSWVQPLSYDAMEHANVERNHWQSHPDQWQSLYFSDPLANIYLGENFGDFTIPIA